MASIPSTLGGAGLGAVIFDLDGVITSTADIHFAAWKTLFDAFLERRAGSRFAPFTRSDYVRWVDGRPRYDGVRGFLSARGLMLPDGHPDDPPGDDTICALGNRKNALFNEALQRQGVTIYPGSVRLLERLAAREVRTGLVSSSRNGRAVLAAAGLQERFDTVVDGNDAARQGLRGKPHPDTFLLAARRLAVAPARCAVVEDAVAGIQAGRAGGFGLVIGVDRGAGRRALVEAGADLVVDDLGELDAP